MMNTDSNNNSMMKKRVLVTSIPCWNDRTGSDTLSSLLDGYGPDDVANLFIRTGTPNSSSCSNYFQISEGAVLHSIFNRSVATGKKCKNNGLEVSYAEKAEKKRYSFFSKHRLSIFLILREIGWFLGKWKSKELDEFVESFDPDVLLFPIESYIFFNRLNMYLIQKTGKKAIGFLWDDNFSYKAVYGLGPKMMRFFLRRNVKKIVRMCDAVLAINPKMKSECDQFFGISSIVLSKGIDLGKCTEPKYYLPQEPVKLLYSGKLNIGRDRSAILLCKLVSKINHKYERIHFDIYTTTQLSLSQKNKLNHSGCCVHDPVSQNELWKIQNNADVLVFLEALSGKYRNAARLSFSTKLTDYLSTGKCILAIGPSDIAPIEYLAEENAGLIASSEEEIEKALLFLLNHKEKIAIYGMNAFVMGKINHNIDKIRRTLWSLF